MRRQVTTLNFTPLRFAKQYLVSVLGIPEGGGGGENLKIIALCISD